MGSVSLEQRYRASIFAVAECLRLLLGVWLRSWGWLRLWDCWTSGTSSFRRPAEDVQPTGKRVGVGDSLPACRVGLTNQHGQEKQAKGREVHGRRMEN